MRAVETVSECYKKQQILYYLKLLQEDVSLIVVDKGLQSSLSSTMKQTPLLDFLEMVHGRKSHLKSSGLLKNE